MKHIWSVLCEKSSIDFESNVLSLFNCIEELKLIVDKTKAPINNKLIIPTNFQIVSYWTMENCLRENLIEIKGEFVDPKGIILNEYKNSFKIKKGVKRFRNRTKMQGMSITESGRYYYKIWQKIKDKFELVSELPLDINLSYKILDKKDQ